MDDIRQCFAYNNKGERCDHPAGHPGNHAITYTWADSECYRPTGTSQPIYQQPPAPIPLPVEVPVAPASCVACQHKHKDGPCKCGCYEFIG